MDFVKDLQKRLARIGLGRKGRGDLLTSEQHTVLDAVDALIHGRITVHTEEVINTRTGAIYYHEVLCRLQDADGSPLNTFQTLMRLQSWGFYREVSGILVGQACAYGLKSQQPIGINIGPQIIQSTNGRRVFAGLLDTWIEAGLKPKNIALEIVESAPFELTPARHAWLQELRSKGIRIGLDDFGEGYHTMYHLRDLPLDFIKLDGHIVHDVLAGKGPAWVAEALDICKERGITVIAEHPHTPAEAVSLQGLGIDYVQSRNLKAADFTHP